MKLTDLIAQGSPAFSDSLIAQLEGRACIAYVVKTGNEVLGLVLPPHDGGAMSVWAKTGEHRVVPETIAMPQDGERLSDLLAAVFLRPTSQVIALGPKAVVFEENDLSTAAFLSPDGATPTLHQVCPPNPASFGIEPEYEYIFTETLGIEPNDRKGFYRKLVSQYRGAIDIRAMASNC